VSFHAAAREVPDGSCREGDHSTVRLVSAGERTDDLIALYARIANVRAWVRYGVNQVSDQ
jgi:hypothetical protein